MRPDSDYTLHRYDMPNVQQIPKVLESGSGRTTVISKDDILNLVIALNTTSIFKWLI